MKNIQRKDLGFGGDYNPEQWSEEVWDQDIELMQEAGVNLVSVGIFSWALIQPEENKFNFDFLDKILDKLYKGGISVDLATATASQPAWLSQRHPDILPVNRKGMRYTYGSRQSYCPNSPSWRKATAVLTRKMAQRYKDHPAVVMWHVNNEYACHTHECFCENCTKAFIDWLKRKYGTVEAVNESWGTRFWSQYYYKWEEILPPRATTAQNNPGQVLDYKRFMSDSLLECYIIEKDILEEITPQKEITTNFMMEFKPLDYFKWAKSIDTVSWDSYPDPVSSYKPSRNALDHDLMRGLNQGRPFLLMEQAPNQVNWRPVNRTKNPGLMRLYSYQALAHGADAIMYFQWRQSRRGAEKFHSGCVTHTGDNKSRVFKEVAALGAELKALSEIADSRVYSDVCLILDYENWWALEYEFRQSKDIVYREILTKYYDYFYSRGISVDIKEGTEDLSQYKMVLAPALYLLKDETAQNLKDFTAGGGSLVMTYSSAMVDKQDAVFDNGYLGSLQEVMGISIEEFDPLEKDTTIRVKEVKNHNDKSDENEIIDNSEERGSLWIDTIHLEGATTEVLHIDDLKNEYPVVTSFSYKKGKSWYMGTQLINKPWFNLMTKITKQAGIESMWNLPPLVEWGQRQKGTKRWTFLLNFNQHAVTLGLPEGIFYDALSGEIIPETVSIKASDVLVLEEENQS